MIIGNFRTSVKLLFKSRRNLPKKAFWWMFFEMLTMIPFCFAYWLLYRISAIFEWVSEKTNDAGDWIYDKIWG